MNPFPLSVQAAHQQLLREQLALLLRTLPDSLQSDVEKALAVEGKLLAIQRAELPQHPRLTAGVWPLLTLLVAQACAPDVDVLYATNVALAIECLVCAIDLFDDLIDDDSTTLLVALGRGSTINIATALTLLAQQALISAAHLPGARSNLSVLAHALNTGAQMVIAGQQRDLQAERHPYGHFSREDCLGIAEAKSGSLMRLACQLGAICAGAEASEVAVWGHFGSSFGIAHQLDNDSHDLAPFLHIDASAILSLEVGILKSDLVRGKKTLPLVYACQRQASLRQQTSLDLAMLQEEVRATFLRDLPVAIQKTWGISLLYRARAREQFHALELRHPVPAVVLLRALLGFEETSTSQ